MPPPLQGPMDTARRLEVCEYTGFVLSVGDRLHLMDHQAVAGSELGLVHAQSEVA